MAIHIIEENEPVTVDGLVTVLFGDPGIGKTSLAMQVEHGFLVDFDGGLHRAKNKCKAARLDNWSDMIGIQNDGVIEKNGFRTLIIDTAGTMLDNFMAQHAMKTDIKNKKADGSLSLQGFGALKNIFNSFVGWCRSQNVNLIFVCHAEQFKEGDDIKYRPKMTGGSYDILVQQADLMGYMNSQNNRRTLEFSHTDKHVGKNTAEFGLITIPEYTSPEFNNFFQRLIDKTKDKIMSLSAEQIETLEKISFYKNTIEGTVKPEELELIRQDIMSEPTAIQLQVTSLLKKQMINIYTDFIKEITTPEQAAAIVEDANQLNKIFSEDIKRSLLKHCLTVNIVYNRELKKFGYKEIELKSENKKSDLSNSSHPNPNVKVSIDHNGKAPVTVYEMPNRTRSNPVQNELKMDGAVSEPPKNGRRLL
jgi:hypothetical protein